MILSIISNSKAPQGPVDRVFMKDVNIIRPTWLSDDEIAIAKTLSLKSDNSEKGRKKEIFGHSS